MVHPIELEKFAIDKRWPIVELLNDSFWRRWQIFLQKKHWINFWQGGG